MSLRRKLTIGLGFLFLIIFALAFYSSFTIQKLSRDADNIIKDNYKSLTYCSNMLVAIDDMRNTMTHRIFQNEAELSEHYIQLFETAKSTFETNLHLENNNITELHEQDRVNILNNDYHQFLDLSMQIMKTGGSPTLYFVDLMPIYTNVRHGITQINDINMQAIERKDLATKTEADTMVISMAVFGTICILLAFFYFWYFPFYISNTMLFLARKMQTLLKTLGIKVESQSRDEAAMLLQALTLLENISLKDDTKQHDHS